MTPSTLLAVIAMTSAADFQSLLDQYRTEQAIPGVSAVVTHQDKVIFAGASGVADLETGRELTADTPMYAGSLSKVLTAITTLRLVQEGELSLESPVPGIAEANNANTEAITVAHLLTHASGLEREGNFGYWFSADFPDKEVLTLYLERTELRAKPGTDVHYSNIGYATLGLVIERASGQSYAKALQGRLLDPLGMTASGAPGPTPGVAVGYTPVGRIIPNEQRPFAGVGRSVGSRHVREYHDAKAMAPAFGIYVSASDMGKLNRFLLGFGGHQVLSETMRTEMLSRQPSGWGLGIKIGRRDGRAVASHGGWFAAHRSHLLLEMGPKIGVIVLTNSDGASPGIIAEGLADAALSGTE